MSKKPVILFTVVLTVGIGVSCCKESPEIVIADPIFEAYCLTHFDKNGNRQIQKSEVKSVKSLNVSDMGIQSLKGLEEFLSLESMDCSRNQLVRLYLSKNERLVTLNCASNELPVLDISNNMNLQTLDCSNNKITMLDLSNCKKLRKLDCTNNPLVTIHVWPDFNAATHRRWDVPEYVLFRDH